MPNLNLLVPMPHSTCHTAPVRRMWRSCNGHGERCQLDLAWTDMHSTSNRQQTDTLNKGTSKHVGRDYT